MLMLCGLLAGCSSSNNSSTTTTAAPTTTSAPVAENTTAAPTDTTAAPSTDLPFVTLTWYYPGTEQKDVKLVEDKLQEYLTQKGLNCRVELHAIDWGAWGDQTNVMISSGENFDIMFSAGWDGYLTKVAKGAFVDISDLWKTYMPNTIAMLPQAYKDAVVVNGKTYGVPTNKDMAHTWGIIYRTDIATEVGADMTAVHSLADLGPVLEKVKAAHPDMVGIAMDKADNSNTQLDWDPICGQTVPAKLYPNKDFTVINPNSTPETLDLLHAMRDFYQKGYINTDAATLEDRRPLYNDGKCFCYTTTLKPLVAADLSKTSGFPYEQLSFTQPFITSNDAQGSINCVSVTSKNPERALMFLELMNTDPVVNNMVNFGIEGTHYQLMPDGMRNWMAGQDRNTVTYYAGADWELGNQFINLLLEGTNPDKWKLYSDMNSSATPSKALGFVFDASNVQTEIAAVTNVNQQYEASLFTGTVDPDTTLPEFLQKQKDAGLDTIIAEAQKQLDAWVTANGK
ncbi:MAG: ABC transporter substrate-binding protein [Oscillospiraceae bacterium]|nr:ABC transporter substrate-binding protein [Oscillospiraceae bacterium]